ncbi:LOW QUALITY PROTEIN: G-type lectin S-receptor-like serine/threonine-protein kinase At1g11410 [Pyrus x bretschneideri]|uniref:LOW QUALITY PROTEIN: G-type lectin S-receptor-like serine/threonine-protein kinase At1g11410 n=1 Tax=Pyrus x bretschneideri TaxID=225117 RepID=UPI00202E9423|nr:LOW QUALITY PROTEIN: G-type lectin S-receptor-like serine/threonine-protein kinase At1g11410 [Pyrus x bretschneideri]
MRKLTMNSTEFFFVSTVLLIFVILPSSISVTLDAITPNQPLREDDVLLSPTKIFALGFFKPGNSRNRYIGVWFNKIPIQTIVWIANRENPIVPTAGTGLLAIHGDHGGLVIYGEDQNNPIWSANLTVSSPNNSVIAKLSDKGNLVVEINGEKVWQGLDYPTDTVLPSMKLGLDRRSGLNRFLTSWKSQDDPGMGNCSYRIEPTESPQGFLYMGQTPLWRSGPWTGERWSGVPQMENKIFFNVTFVNDQDEVSIMYSTVYESIIVKMVIDESGNIERSAWQGEVHKWAKHWSAPDGQCDFYGKCGPNSICDPYPKFADKFECNCLPGFEPKLQHEWYLRDWSGGCVRQEGSSVCQNGEGFVKLERLKLPNTSTARVNMSRSREACKEECLRNCSCTAYANADERQGGSGCITWHGDLMDTRTFLDTGQDLYVRVHANVSAQHEKKSNSSFGKKRKLGVSVACGLLFFLLFSLACWLVKRKRKGKRSHDKFLASTSWEDSSATTNIDESGINSELPFFELSTIVKATNNFASNNQLGAGGFGSVYKGVLDNGKEIAVKRLAKNSSQGIGEFKNEVVLLSKLQHRNLVRILGCCVQDEEKMLIYEYLPNKSLDFFIFAKEAFLDWTRRFEIICGIARGILYLHQDSRLRIIHRDLKASNVLLDSAMNPKISDFGMARIFGAEQIQANTNRVVGTYGYMSPEYAMEGLFSVKSDVYSFGVLLLEIVTGRKNTGYYHDSPYSNLVGHVWDLWKENRALEIIDSSLGESYPVNEVLRCFHIALLCIQEKRKDRPLMSAVVFMLGNDATIPSPKQPGFLLNRGYHTSGDPSSNTDGAYSVNGMTYTEAEGR